VSKVVLVITDGIGHNENKKFNAFANANKNTYNYLFDNVPNSLIKTYGKYVGLPDNQMGNSEVGHMSIGSGRVLYQDLVKISLSISQKTMTKNRALNSMFVACNTIHLVGLCSDGGVHSHIEHIIELAKLCKINGKKVLLHLVTDGRDVDPKSCLKYIKQVENICDDDIHIATISGRFYSMDRDNRWDRVELSYKAIANANPCTKQDFSQYIRASYFDNITDEFLLPMAFGDYNGFANGDGLIMCNFRSDRAREITSAFGIKDFDKFDTTNFITKLITLTKYDDSFPFEVMFDKDIPSNTLSQVISDNGLRQLHISETEKYAHVTYFFNGGLEAVLLNEKRVLIDSPKVTTYDLQPEMSAKEVCDGVLNGINDGYDFIVVNFANGDMVGHTGNFEASVKAVEFVDKQIRRVLDKARDYNYSTIITSDHGNCEKMADDNGNILTNHTVGDVYCFVDDKRVELIEDGSLCNIAPTILKLMDLEIPKEMKKPLF
jgi:2,3-bisphosphoglycerate-independent phosphoglycerate mutase